MQMIHTCYRSLSKNTNTRMFCRHQLIVSIILFALYSKSAEELCFVSVAMKDTNLVYYVAEPKGGTDIPGVVRYLDKCISYASTNVCVHIRVNNNVLFAHVAPLLKICLKRNLTHVIFYWPVGKKDTDDMLSFSFQFISLLGDTSAVRMLPFLDEDPIIFLNPNGTGIRP